MMNNIMTSEGMENIISFAKMNPWSAGFTFLTVIVFIIVLFLINGKNSMNLGAKLEQTGLNIFMVFMIIVASSFIVIMAMTPTFSTWIDHTEDAVLIYWCVIGVLWSAVKYITGINIEDLW